MTCPRRRCSFTLSLFVLTLLTAASATAQMRQVYLDNGTYNHIRKICFYSGSEGYVSFTNWLGYTTDSGKTFIQKNVTNTNVDFNGYYPNLIFGFDIGGVKAFNRDTLILYGNYGQVPSILYSVNGGNSYKLVYQSQLILYSYSYGVTDMAFPSNSNIGFATEADRIIRTTDRGKTWSSVREDAGSFFDYIEAIDDNNLFVFATTNSKTKLLKTSNTGTSWQQLALPAGDLRYACFLTTAKGWLNMQNNGLNDFYYTSNGAASWTKMNTPEVTGYYGNKMRFVNDSTGYIIGYQYNIFKTTDSGRRWELLPRNNNYENLGFGHLDIHFRDNNQFWAGGDFGFLELTSNGGGTPLPKAFFRIDTIGVSVSNTVNLLNFSKSGYQYSWYKNGILISTAYNASYTHDVQKSGDTIALIVKNGAYADTLIQYQYFNVPQANTPSISAFSPTTATSGNVVTITGVNLNGAIAVSFGGVPALSYTVVSATSITAVVGKGASGNVSVTTPSGTGSLGGFTYYKQLKVTSFAPASGAVGSSVTIKGSRFGSTPADNIVYMGAVRATVTAASDTQLVVTVPIGASYRPISVTNAGQTAYSQLPFVVTYAGGGAISTATYPVKLVFPADDATRFMTITDLDGDGKADIAMGNYASAYNRVTVLRNTSTPGNASFAPVQYLSQGAGYSGPGDVVSGDLDGDGKPEIIASTAGLLHQYSIFKNNSTPGNIVFDTLPADYISGLEHLCIADMNGDGKPDIIGGTVTGQIYIYQNTSTGSALSFTRLNFYASYYISGGNSSNFNEPKCIVHDFDGDGKPDIFVVSALGASSQPLILRNTTVNGVVSFTHSAPLSSYCGYRLAAGDLDGDGKPDVAAIDPAGGIAILRNTSSSGVISFDPAVTIPASVSTSVAISDINGDGKPDLALGDGPGAYINLLENKSSAGTISFGSPVGIPVQASPVNTSDVSLSDLDGDGKPDLEALPFSSHVYIYINNAAASNVQFCEGSGITLTSSFTGTTYQWEQNTGAGFTAISDNSNFSGTNTLNLQLSNIPLSWNSYQYRCLVNGSNYSSVFTTKVNPSIKPSISISTPLTAICSATSVTFTATTSNAGGSPAYEWMINNHPIGNNSKTFTTTTLSNNDKIRAVVTSAETCASPLRDSSNTIAMTVTPTTIQSIQIYAHEEVSCAGDLVTFTSYITGSGSNPTYQWWVNATRVGNNADTFSSRTIPDASNVYLEMTSSLTCLLGSRLSNVLLMKVNQSVTPFLNVIASATTVDKGKTTSLTATATNGGPIPVYQWQDSTHTAGWTNIAGATGSTLTYAPLVTGDKVRCMLTSNASCANPASVVSGSVTFTVNVPTAIAPVPATAYGLHAYPNPASSMLTIDTLSLTDHWQTLDVMSIDGKQRLLSQSIGNTTRVTVNVGRLTQGIYMVILRRKSGEAAYFKFLKVY